MSLFKKPSASPAYLKMGIYGEAGSGKTFTASHIAKGLALLIGKSGKPPTVTFLDTENGATFVEHIFVSAGVEFLVYNTRAFSDLKEAVLEAQAANAILIADSMTHFWEEVREAYLAAKRARLKNPHARLELPDWNVIKPAWGQFTTTYLNSKCHIILCGRAGNVYEFQEREEDGRKEMITAGTRMAAEKGMGYEPNLLVEMTSRQAAVRGKAKTIVRTATVLKDRSDLLDGHQFTDPTFENFLPHIQRLNLGGDHSGFDASRTSAGLFPADGNGRDGHAVRRKIVVEELDALLLERGFGGTSQESKLKRGELIKKHFKCTSRTEIEDLMPLNILQANFDSLHQELTGGPSRYGAKTAPVNDEIPHLGSAKKLATEQPQAVEPQPEELAKEPDDLDTIIHDFEVAIVKERDATKRKALWDATAEYRNAMSEALLTKIKGVYGKALMAPNGKPVRGAKREAA